MALFVKACALGAQLCLLLPTALRAFLWRDILYEYLHLDIELFLFIAAACYVFCLIGFVSGLRVTKWRAWVELLALLAYPALFVAVVSIWDGWSYQR